ncbi:MAG: 2-amino-3-carboxymuconate-6-semialdehyde decarboxylase [uncultured Acetobacteraceae bacterium]|uniref:2-amino-3-carboxymuconate-6-semialdehyde decarboxylase n=1 Tax=uncultured Acetobacteraceae bacterium TaxID=169975 RepID=A0A6J4IBD1_9PROT|nr:MAG: 2-amino-3-carboxymuconate-6-semialdehyde decarboxylase [uncultured Acetobacteraceae bacterium]
MTSRRNFLTGAAATGVVFCSCGMLDAARAQSPGGRRLPVAIDGKRVKTIDVHAHCHFREAAALLGADASVLTPRVNGAEEAFIEIAQRFKAMDAQAVDMEVLSINPFWYGRDRDLAAQIVKVQNEKLAELCAAHPDRFAAFASLTLQAPDLAVQELETAVRRQGLKGAAIGGMVNGVEFSDPKFHPVWAKAEELGAVLFIHPQGVPELSRRLGGNGWLTNAIGNPLETTIALSHLIFEGTLDRFPGLKIIAAHGGGYLPSYADRSDHACLVGPAGCNPNITLKKKPTEYLKQLYFDSLVFSPEAIRHLAAQVGPDQIVLGSDYPYPWQLHPVDHIFACDSLNEQQKAAVLGETAARLLKING